MACDISPIESDEISDRLVRTVLPDRCYQFGYIAPSAVFLRHTGRNHYIRFRQEFPILVLF